MSLKEEIDGVFIANSIRMDSFNEYYILVEGENDELFYSKFLNENQTQIEICHGKDNVLNAIKILDNTKHGKKYIGLVDKDYDFLFDEIIESENLIRTDFHDIETMCISSESFDNFTKEYFNKSKTEKLKTKNSKSIKEHIIDLALPMAQIRIVNAINQYAIKFKPSGKETKPLDYSKFICKNSYDFLGFENLLEALKKYYNQGLPIKNEDLINQIKSLDLSKYEILDICHGHDLTKIIVIGMKKVIGKSNLSNTKQEEIERVLRLAYSKEDFDKTTVRRQIMTFSEGLLK
tara:strand:+ start:398 stop:1270 length:873 start_codon:yes stop_codon:yes gene_type:complete